MKKIIFSLLGLALVFSLVGVAIAISNQGAEKSKAPDLEKIEFIHWKKGYGKPEGVGKAPKTPTCYAFLGKYGKTYLKWTTLPVDYAINPANPQGLDTDFVTNAVFNSAETWDAATGKELMNDTYTTDDTATYGAQDYKNAISFGNYPTENVIAVTTIWYNSATKAIVEFDVMFDTDFLWGDATNPETPNAMDLQNIATHELGHGVGLGDVYDSVCSEITMYGYSDYGEIIKRTLAQPDINGLQKLYGI